MNINKTSYQLDIINRIKELRIEKGISQQKLASSLFICNGQIGNIESPKFQHKYTLKQLCAISNILDTSIDFILTGSHDKLTTDELIKLLIQYDE